MKRLLVFGFVLGCAACVENPSKRDKGISTIKSSITGCYVYMENGDTILLNLHEKNGTVSGKLLYQLDGKDRNTGTIVGSMRENVLLADYTFRSEGVTSVRQVAFKKKGTTFRDGTGEMTEKNGKMWFSDPDKLKFNTGPVLTKTVCP